VFSATSSVVQIKFI